MGGRYKPRAARTPQLRAQVDQALERKADLVLFTAQVTAPVDTGDYKASLRKDKVANGWRISANVRYAVYLEFGTRFMRAYRTLGRALDAARGK